MTTTEHLKKLIKAGSQPFFLHSLLAAFSVWSVIGVTIFSSWVLFPPFQDAIGTLVFLFAVFIVSTRQHAMGVLTHEGAHYLFSRHRPLNDWFTRVCFAFPFFASLSKYRLIHWEHHRHTYQNLDPDYVIYKHFPIQSKKLKRLLLRDLAGFHVWKNLKYFLDLPYATRDFNRRFLGSERLKLLQETSDTFAFLLFWAVVLTAGSLLWGLTFWKVLVLYWILPFVTINQAILRIRGAIEHGAVPDSKSPYLQTRTYIVPPLLAFVVSPYNVNYHLEHHLYPTVRWNYLPKLHQQLKSSDYLQNGAFIQSFRDSLNALVKS